jgi:deoxyhypusine synthase
MMLKEACFVMKELTGQATFSFLMIVMFILKDSLTSFLKKCSIDKRIQEKYYQNLNYLYHLGFELKDEKSILYWASKNNIPYFCPGLYDGALGDVLYFFKRKHPEFIIDSAKDTVLVHDIAINTEKAGIIALGGGAPKHLIANINQFRDGADYAIIITTAQEYEGSNAGANIEESISWGKVKPDAKHVKIVSEATLVFPLFVKAGFVDYKKNNKEK